jgi:hypothetical protein
MNAVQSIACMIALIIAPAALSQELGDELMTTSRLRAVAMQTDPPGPMSLPYTELLKNVADAVKIGNLDLAAFRFKNFLERQRSAGRKGVPNGYLDFVLHRVATAESEDAASADDRIRYYAAQENAVSLHLSTLEKQYAYRAGSRLPDFTLREPVLGTFGKDEDAIRQGLPQKVNTEGLPERIGTWRKTLDDISRKHTEAIGEFCDAVRDNPNLLKRLSDAEAPLRAVILDVF